MSWSISPPHVKPPYGVKRRRLCFPQAISSRKLQRDVRFHYLCGYWLSEFVELPYGIPSHDTFGRVFALLDPAGPHPAFISWMSALATLCEEVIALDGTTIRRSLDRADGKGPIHVVSAWASRNELVLAQFKVDAKSNEITALPELLSMLNLDRIGKCIFPIPEV